MEKLNTPLLVVKAYFFKCRNFLLQKTACVCGITFSQNQWFFFHHEKSEGKEHDTQSTRRPPPLKKTTINVSPYIYKYIPSVKSHEARNFSYAFTCLCTVRIVRLTESKLYRSSKPRFLLPYGAGLKLMRWIFLTHSCATKVVNNRVENWKHEKLIIEVIV